MSAPAIISSGTSSGGPPVGGSGLAGTLPIWVGATTLGDSAITQVSGSIFSLTGLVAGTGYPPTDSVAVALGGGTGTGATALLIVNLTGNITWVQLADPGSGYTAGDVLTIPGGVGGTITVLAVVTKNDAAGHLTAQRIGAGTTQPNAGLDSRFGAWIRGASRVPFAYSFGTPGSTPGTSSSAPFMLAVGNTIATDYAPFGSSASTINGVLVYHTPLNSAATLSTVNGLFLRSNVAASSGAGSLSNFGAVFQSARAFAADLNTNTTLIGVSSTCLVSGSGSPLNSFTNNGMRCYVAQLSFSAPGSTTESQNVRANIFVGTAAQTIGTISVFDQGPVNIQAAAAGTVVTNFYGVRLQTATSANWTITNKYPHAQEDTDGRNYFRSPTFFGSAVGTARSATNPSVEVEAVSGVSNGDVRLRSASAVFDASNSSTNGTKYFARTTGTDLPTTTTQSWYEEGTYTPAGNVNFTLGTCTGTWTRIGRKVFVTLNFAAGVNNGSTVAGASSLGLPNGLAPVRSGLGLRAQVTGAASGNGLVAVNAATGLIEISTTVALDTNAKVIQCEYEV